MNNSEIGGTVYDCSETPSNFEGWESQSLNGDCAVYV